MDYEFKKLVLEMACFWLRAADGNPQEAIKKFEEYQTFVKEWIEQTINIAFQKEKGSLPFNNHEKEAENHKVRHYAP